MLGAVERAEFSPDGRHIFSWAICDYTLTPWRTLGGTIQLWL
jgi:hypothetical protein